MRLRFPARSRARTTMLALAATASLGVAACHGGPPQGAGTPAVAPSVSLPAPRVGGFDPASDPTVEVVKRVAPAVVNVTTTVASSNGLGGIQQGRDVGTGFIVRSDGIIVTNYHVVEGALTIRVTLNVNGKSYAGHVIGGDSAHDLAILKIGATGLPTVPLGDSGKVLLGEPVVAIGYPLALEGEPTVTAGIISATARTVKVQDPNGPTRTYEDALQTDAAINPGNSGGPLVDLNGNVIGINTAGVPSSQANTIGFAIAIDAARPIIEQAIANPRGEVAYMGVVTETVTPSVASQQGFPVKRGALVLVVTRGGPAAAAGIKVDDFIVSLNGTAVTGSDQLGSLIRALRPGQTVTVGLVSSTGAGRSVRVTLGVRPLP